MNKAVKHVLWWTIGVVVVIGASFGIAQLVNKTPAPVAEYPTDKVGSADWVLGKRDAKVVLIEYSDLQCPACAAYYSVMSELHAAYPDTLAIVYREFPLRGTHQNADNAANAAEAAGIQGKFWEMHDQLFKNQNAWANLSDPLDTFADYAQQIGLDVTKFKSDYTSQAVKDKVNQQLQSGEAAKVDSTPTFFLQGVSVSPAASLDAFKPLIEDALKKAPIAESSNEPVHIHANIRVVVEGTPIDFSLDRYQKNAEGGELNPDIHFHNKNGDVIHIHKAGITVSDLFGTFSMSLGQDCITLDTSTTKCATGSNKLRMYVNGTENSSSGSYAIGDLDRILVIFGSEDESVVQKQIKAVPDTACIYSRTCPERGSPPPEECTGGSGTNNCQ
ncbi:MAG: thioredoxin domain-containing protein [Candidatus Kerfeldbacteria bacterium]